MYLYVFICIYISGSRAIFKIRLRLYIYIYIYILYCIILYCIILHGLPYTFRYHAALRNTGLVTLSTPYIDAFGTGAIITAAHTIYRGEANNQHTTNDQVIGVLGADFPLSYFQK